MIIKTISELRIDVGGDGSIDASTPSPTFQSYSHNITSEPLVFNLVGEYGSLDFAIATEPYEPTITFDSYDDTLSDTYTVGLYGTEYLLVSTKTHSTYDTGVYFNTGNVYVNATAPELPVASGVGYYEDDIAGNMEFVLRNPTLQQSTSMLTTYLVQGTPVDEIFVDGGNEYVPAIVPVLWDNQRRDGGQNVLTNSLPLKINAAFLLNGSISFSASATFPRNYNVDGEGRPITGFKQIWTF